MKYTDLEKIMEAPERGWVLAYTQKQVYLKPYESMRQIEQFLNEQDFLEIHLFNREIEYRAIVTRSKRFGKGFIETIVTGEENIEQIFAESIMLDGRFAKEIEKDVITINNHISYDENGMARIDNYRIVMEGDK